MLLEQFFLVTILKVWGCTVAIHRISKIYLNSKQNIRKFHFLHIIF